MRVAFLINDLQLSGGVGVVIAHASQLAEHHDFEVTLVLAREQEAPHWRYDALADLHVASLAEAHAERFDVAVGTWWETAFSLFTIPAERYAIFLQSLEDRFYKPDEAAGHWASLVTGLPVAYITEARWIAATLDELRPDATVHLVRNGIDKTIFAGPDRPPVRLEGPLRVLIEGNAGVWFKRVPEAIAAARLMREPHHVTLVSGAPVDPEDAGVDRVLSGLSHAEMAELYAESDVLLKLSSVEGMFGPPLEAFHMATTCVVAPVTGHDEYIEHGWNGLVTDWDDPRGTARLLDLLARDRALLHRLRWGALATAGAWPDWERQGTIMAGVLRRVRSEPPPSAPAAMIRLLADVRAGMEVHQSHLEERKHASARLERFDRALTRTRARKILAARRHPLAQRATALLRKAD